MESLREWQPYNVTVTPDGGGGYCVSWIGRARLGNDLVPVHSQWFDGYRVDFIVGSTSYHVDTTAQSACVDAATIATQFGAGAPMPSVTVRARSKSAAGDFDSAPAAPATSSVPASSEGALPGGYVGVPYSNVGAFGDPWKDLGVDGYRYVTGDFWPGATVNHAGPASSTEWINEVVGIPHAAGTYAVTARVDVGGSYYDHPQSVTIAAKPSFAVWDFSGRAFAGVSHTGEIPAFTGVTLDNAGILDCAGWTSGKVYCEMYVSAEDGALLLGVHGASLSNKYVGPGNANTLGEYASVGQYALAFDTGTGDLWVRDAGGWIGGGDPSAGTSPTRSGLTASVNGRFRFAAAGRGTIKANFGNEAWVYSTPAGFAGVAMPAVVVPALWDIQSLPIGTRVQISVAGAGSSTVSGSLISEPDMLVLATQGKSSGKVQFEATNPRISDDERIGICTSAFDRAEGLLGQAGTENSIGVRNAVIRDGNVKIETCFGGVHSEYLIPWNVGVKGYVGIFTFACDFTAGTVSVFADGSLLRTITGVPAGTYFPACAGGFSASSELTTTGLSHPVATYSDWTTTV